MSDTILKVENLEVFYGSIQALKGMNFEVRKGEVVSLIGANGAGKTTTLRALSGLVPCKGSITFKGQRMNDIPAHLRVPMGLAQSPEGRGIFPQMSVLENLQMGAFTRKDKDGIAKDMEHCFQLFPRLRERQKQLAGTLSGGEQQMVAIDRKSVV